MLYIYHGDMLLDKENYGEIDLDSENYGEIDPNA